MKTLHRVDVLGTRNSWCGVYNASNTNFHDGTTEPLDNRWAGAGFVMCERCVDMHGDVLPSQHKKPILVHSAPLPHPCGGKFTDLWSSRLSPEQCMQDQAGWSSTLVPCRKCLALLAGKPSVTAPAKKVDDGFNGNCLRCNMRVYMGATPAAYEHQGGRCPKAL